ncbi:hypothetical protein GJ699_30690 [Duganella sp. FT80W]|uniref:Uncharacterized protein n=1 Tax=Duganella guangzhouensis TaxID=2666084 RepID=A0A6I2L986_9BURK|nr:hypothetical protein [Duganella guangzhouensis]MRW94350.1 hypothetical protein [Duganella guangzhouensis]
MLAAETTSWRRRGWLALIVGAHLAAFWCWQAPQRSQVARLARHAAITYILAPAVRPLPVPPPPASPVTARRARQEVATAPAPARAAVEPQAITLPPAAPAAPAPQAAVEPTLEADPFAAPTKPSPDLKQRAIAGALAADKEARKASFTQRDRKLVNDESALAAAIGKAYVGGGSGPIGEISMPDGTRVTKWRLPGGAVVCYYKESNNGLDPFNNSGRLSVRSCP